MRNKFQEGVSTKHCWRCKETKTFENFHKSRGYKDGYAGICKPCAKLHGLDWIRINRLKHRERSRLGMLKLRAEKPHLILRAAKKCRDKKSTPRHQTLAHLAIRYALKAKRITRQPCCICGEVKTEATTQVIKNKTG